MSSDWQDTNAVWHGNTSQGEVEDLSKTPPLPAQQDQLLVDSQDDLSALQFEEDAGESSGPYLTKTEVVGALMRQLSPLLAPLLFGSVTFLFILPFILGHKAYLSTSGSLPSGLLLLAVGVTLFVFAIGQGLMLYYAGSNDALWSLGMIGGFALFLLTGCFAIFGPLPSIILLAVLIILGFLFGRLCMRKTPEGRVDIVEAFGKHSRTLFPGLNFLAPWEKVLYTLDTREKMWSSPMQSVPVSLSEEVHLAANISYQLLPEDAHLAALYVENWERNLQQVFVSTLQNSVGQLSPQDFIMWPQDIHTQPLPKDADRWQRINMLLTQAMQELVAHWGVQINWVHIRDVTLVPHVPAQTESKPVASRQPASAGPAPATAPAPSQPPAQPAPAQNSRPAQPESPQPAPVAQVAPTANSSGTTPKAEMLIEAYNAVRTGRITDPVTIREIAARFETLANNPEEYQAVHFDAVRAAQMLLERAKYFEEQMMAVPAYTQGAQPEWSKRHPSDDNMLAGG